MSTPVIPTAPLTALDAVNQMLQSIGQGLVNSYETSASVDAQNAKFILANATREIQSRGWWFNREYDYPLTADSEGRLLLPASCLQFDVTSDRDIFVERGRQLYNRTKHTAVFEPGYEVRGDIVWQLPFDDLPMSARLYASRRAGREFQISAVGSDLLYRFTREMEEEARADLDREHLRAVGSNVLYDSGSTSRVVLAAGRRIPNRWR